MFRVAHVWQLKHDPMGASPYWLCENCGSRVHTTAKQKEHNKYRRPNPRRKFDGMFCGELVVKKIHES